MKYEDGVAPSGLTFTLYFVKGARVLAESHTHTHSMEGRLSMT